MNKRKRSKLAERIDELVQTWEDEHQAQDNQTPYTRKGVYVCGLGEDDCKLGAVISSPPAVTETEQGLELVVGVYNVEVYRWGKIKRWRLDKTLTFETWKEAYDATRSIVYATKLLGGMGAKGRG